MPLKFIGLSGITAVTENLYVYEYGNDMIVVDCGVGFPEPEMYGVDLVVPDMGYILKNREKLRGILITHGHEDHLGAVPFLLKEVKTSVFATKLTAGFIEDKLLDYEMKGYKINVFDPERDVITLGVFKITPFRVSHSVPDAAGFCIDTPEGKIFHVPDYKFDWTSVDRRPFDVAKVAILASGGSLALASDALGSLNLGYTESERTIEGRIEAISEKARGQIFFTTISSNISRIQQALNVAEKMGRKASLIGRSIMRKAEIARKLGYLSYPPDLVVSPKKAAKLAKDKIMYIISGSYGQNGSALYRTVLGEHETVSIEEGDTVIFSSDPAPPGSKSNVDFLVDRIIQMGVDVHYYDMQEDLHVSGHGSQEDIKMLFGIVKPKYYIPIGGTVRHNRGYKIIAMQMGAREESVLELSAGDVVEFSKGQARMGEKIHVKNVLVDGLGVGDVGNIVLRDRQVLAREGIAIVILQFDKSNSRLGGEPEIFSRGFVFEREKREFLEYSAKELSKVLGSVKRLDEHVAKNETVNFLEKFFYKETGRRPMVLPVVVEV